MKTLKEIYKELERESKLNNFEEIQLYEKNELGLNTKEEVDKYYESREIELVKSFTEAQKIKYVKENYWSIQWVTDPSDKICKAAIREDVLSMDYIDNPSESVQLEYIKRIDYGSKFEKRDARKYIKDGKISSKKALELFKKMEKTYKVIK
jgi:hypothetical protein